MPIGEVIEDVFSTIVVDGVKLVLSGVKQGARSLLPDLPVTEVRRFEAELHEYFATRYSGLLAEIRDTGALPGDDALTAAVHDFHTSFVAGLTDAASE